MSEKCKAVTPSDLAARELKANEALNTVHETEDGDRESDLAEQEVTRVQSQTRPIALTVFRFRGRVTRCDGMEWRGSR